MSQWADDPDFKASPGFLGSLGQPADPPKEPMRPAEFAQHFAKHAGPQLRNLAKAEGFCAFHGVETFSDAVDVVMKHARILGADYLPEDEIFKLQDFIMANICKAIDGLEASGCQCPRCEAGMTEKDRRLMERQQ